MRHVAPRAILALFALFAALVYATPVVHARHNPPGIATLLLHTGDLPAGYRPDAALENADATARTSAYTRVIAATAFTAYRTNHTAIVQYVARLHRRTDTRTVLAAESGAVRRTHGTATITLPARYGDRTTLAYQLRGTQGGIWVFAAFADGPYVTAIGAYDKASEQAAVTTLARLASLADHRLRVAARLTPDIPPPPEPPLRLVSLRTTTRQGHASALFRPHSAVYWHAVWRVGHVPRGAREAVRVQLWRGKQALYSARLIDAPYPGDNALADHVQLANAAPGAYRLTITVMIGRLTARATHSFRVAPAPAPPKRR